MDPTAVEEYDRSRDLSGKAVRSLCYAPHANVFFEMHGRVQVCCWNWQWPIGNARTQSFDEMWSGARAQMLRRALEKNDFSKGCAFCERQTADNWTSRPVMRIFDRFAVPAADPQWPEQMEFSISNACNLECVMCNGEFSSAIRAHREKLPATQKHYSAEFVESLRKYLPRLRQAKFLGGEPFLIYEYYRIWEMMVEDAADVSVHVTTNGTQYNRRVEEFMQKLNFSFAVSLDGATKQTVESIRVNANFDEQMAILRTLRQYTTERKTGLDLTFCLMQQNWHEFGDYCLMADEWNCGVFVNTVDHPKQFSINALPAAELRKIVDSMQTQAVHLDAQLKRNRAVWFAHFERLRLRCENLERTALTA
jgi:molybdenum cofactor biosynthesis enzyme MoaA